MLEADTVLAPGPGQVLLEAVFSTLSPGTEHALLAGDILPLPQTLGYSLAARVAGIGEGVTEFEVGEGVVATASHARFQCIDQRAVTPIPAGVHLEQAAFFNLAHTALYAIRRSGLQLGEACLVMGQGLVGAMTAQLALAAGAAPVMVTDIDEHRLDLARAIGIRHAINPDQSPDELRDLVATLGTGGVPVIFEATGAREPLRQAAALVSERGRIVMISASEDGSLPDLGRDLMMKGAALLGGYINSKPFALYRSDLTIQRRWPPALGETLTPYRHSDSWSSDEDIRAIFRLLEQGSLDLAPLISHRFHWREIPDAYHLVWERDPDLLGGLIDWREPADEA